ncbi:MAG: DUF4861 domain-containing protein, partial [Flavobacteriales bacterium]
MRKILLITIATFFAGQTFAQKKSANFSIENSSSLKRNGELVRINWSDVLKLNPSIDTANFQVVENATSAQIPYQLEKLGGSEVKYLLVQVSVDAKSSIKLSLINKKSTPVKAKTYGRYVPERKDDFAWENDKVAFRMYGKALEGSNENAYGMDVWVKSTSELVVNKRYKLNDYHKDHGDGLDYYSVGKTLGVGDMAPYLNDTARYLGNYSSYKILDNGPLRTTFQLIFDEATVNGQTIKVQKTISIDAGSQMNKIENVYSVKGAKQLPVGVGLATRNEKDKTLLENTKGIIGYWEPAHGPDGITGVGAVLTSNINIVRKKDQVLAITTVKSDQPVIYYAGAAWNKAGEIKTSQQWFDYLT